MKSESKSYVFGTVITLLAIVAVLGSTQIGKFQRAKAEAYNVQVDAQRPAESFQESFPDTSNLQLFAQAGEKLHPRTLERLRAFGVTQVVHQQAMFFDKGTSYVQLADSRLYHFALFTQHGYKNEQTFVDFSGEKPVIRLSHVPVDAAEAAKSVQAIDMLLSDIEFELTRRQKNDLYRRTGKF